MYIKSLKDTSCVELVNCPVCGSRYHIVYKISEGDIVRCKNNSCGLMFRCVQPGEKLLSELYAKLYYPDSSGKAKRPNSSGYKFQQHLRYLGAYIDLRNSKVLDYGCGVGNFLDQARGFGVKDAVGLEKNNMAREIVRKRGFRVFENVEQIKGMKFDLIYMNDVIEHLRDPLHTLQDLYSCLVPGGYIFLVTMNMNSLKHFFLRRQWDIVRDPTHLFFFDRKSLRFLLQKVGVFSNILDCRLWVKFEHHGVLRNVLQFILVKFGMDGAIKILAQKRI